MALVTKLQACLPQRAAFVLTLNELVAQVTPIVVTLRFTDNLDLNGLYKTFEDPNADTEVVAEAVISLYERSAEAEAFLKNEWRRASFMAGPGYKHWPEPLWKSVALTTLAYREVEATLFQATCKWMTS